MGYDTNLFIEIIDDHQSQGIQYLRKDYCEGVHVHFYQGKKGNLVMIDTSDEFLPDSIAKGYLEQLGLFDLIPLLFPDKVNVEDRAESVESPEEAE